MKQQSPLPEQTAAGICLIYLVHQDKTIGSLIQTDMMTEICAMAVIHGRYIYAPSLELGYQRLVMNSTC